MWVVARQPVPDASAVEHEVRVPCCTEGAMMLSPPAPGFSCVSPMEYGQFVPKFKPVEMSSDCRLISAKFDGLSCNRLSHMSPSLPTSFNSCRLSGQGKNGKCRVGSRRPSPSRQARRRRQKSHSPSHRATITWSMVGMRPWTRNVTPDPGDRYHPQRMPRPCPGD